MIYENKFRLQNVEKHMAGEAKEKHKKFVNYDSIMLDKDLPPQLFSRWFQMVI